MMEDSAVHVRSFRARHQAPDAAGMARCQAAQRQLLDGELEAALARLAGADEVVVLRRLQLQLSLSPRHSDRANARRWSDGLAHALARALSHAPARDLLRFANRRQALQVFVGDAIAGNDQRDWAWQRLGWLPVVGAQGARGGHGGSQVSATARRDALLRWLADDDEASVPLLRRLLPTAAWPALLTQLSDAELRGLAASVLMRIGDSTAAAFATAPPAAWLADAAGPGAAADGASAAWSAIVGATWQAAATPVRRGWALRLACMLDDPALARHGAAAVDAAVQQALAGGAPDAAAASTPTRPASRHDPSAAASGGSVQAAAPPAPDPAGANAQTAWTDFGGLLLLLPLLPRCQALPLLEDPAVWPNGTGLRLALHSLALQLLPLAADDAAALAFCGLPPQAAPPRLQAQAQLSPAQLSALQQAAQRLTALLATALPAWRGPALLDRVARRRARIVAEPGWLELHLSLRDVSVDLRRAALDLDPGFIPWLGLVLKVRYE